LSDPVYTPPPITMSSPSDTRERAAEREARGFVLQEREREREREKEREEDGERDGERGRE
jgi:hypothetical protein